MKLKPFAPADFPFEIQVTVEWKARVLMVNFSVSGDIKQIKLLPDGHTHNGRQDELWKTTCFEWFFKPLSRDEYWECNLSPSGYWQIYRFDSYRNGMQAEQRISAVSEQITVLKNSWSLESAVDLSTLPLPPGDYLMNLTAVIERTNGEKSYWALQHPVEKPDFHQPECFKHRIHQA